MAPAVSVHDLPIGGITVTAYGLDELRARNRPAAVCAVIVLHGRTLTRQDVAPYCRALCAGNSPSRPVHLLALAFDQRNHGQRLLDKDRNEDWGRGNRTHERDMFGLQYGTACDASYVADVFPAFLGREVDIWAITGISLGGHASMLAAVRDPRFAFCAPIIGCGDFEELMKYRHGKTKAELRPEAPVSAQLRAILRKVDPIHNIEKFKNRPLLFAAGGKDKLVPPSASTRFLEALRDLNGERCEVFVDEEAKHEFTPPMAKKCIEFLWREAEALAQPKAKAHL
ncbi:Alpha/Beta hydrolase protein [Hyaloraphidium curvatum]|nr:Alpha/Beta hydrolase protein [Hyaloraphidium curvatum]